MAVAAVEMGMKGMLWFPDVSVWGRAATAAEPVQGEKVLPRDVEKFRGVTARDQMSFLCIWGGCLLGCPPRSGAGRQRKGRVGSGGHAVQQEGEDGQHRLRGA